MLDRQAEEHYRSRDDLLVDCELLQGSGLFDACSYRAATGIPAEVNAAEHYLLVGWRNGVEPGPDFEGGFLYPYFRSVGFNAPAAITYFMLREAGWPVYATRAQAESVSALIRANRLFDADGYAAQLGYADQLDPALHYVIVGEQLDFS